MRIIDTISYSLTTHCNMKCPDCCAGITALPKSLKSFYSWDYIVESAKYFKGMNINLTGGEASVHPKFEEFVPKLKELFESPKLTVWTNGTMFKKKPDVWGYFDEIHITNYTKDTFDGSPDNTEDIKWIRDKYPNKKINSCEIVHIPKEQRGSKACFRAYSETVEFVDGRIYPCCASSALSEQVYVNLSDNWKEEVLKLIHPCHVCLFAEK